MLQIIAISILLGSASVDQNPYNYFTELGFSSESFNISKSFERVEGLEFQGERFFVKAVLPISDRMTIQFDHFIRQSNEIEYNSMKSTYSIIGYEYLVTTDRNGINQRKHLAWFGHSFNKWRINSRLSFSTDFYGFQKAVADVRVRVINFKGLFISPRFEGSKLDEKEWWKLSITGEFDLRRKSDA